MSVMRKASGVGSRSARTWPCGGAQARPRASASIRGGLDPAVEKKLARDRAKAAEAGIGTFTSVITAYFENGPGQHLRTKAEQLKRIRSVFKDHLTRPAIEIKPAELQRTVDAHPATISAARAVGYSGPLLAWASKRDLMRAGFALGKPHANGDDREELSAF